MMSLFCYMDNKDKYNKLKTITEQWLNKLF